MAAEERIAALRICQWKLSKLVNREKIGEKNTNIQERWHNYKSCDVWVIGMPERKQQKRYIK